MNILTVLLSVYLTLINIIAVAVTIYDKSCAKRRKWRIKESTLLLISALGGGVGMYLAMLAIRHKTRHPKFMLGIPLITAAELIVIFLIWRYIYA